MTRLQRTISISFATGLGSGFFPVAPGTMGTLVGVLFVYAVGSGTILWVSTLMLVALGIWASHHASQYFHEADCQKIVIDEIAGFSVCMLSIPVTPYWLTVAFLLFRFFDISKLPPAHWIDKRMKNALGIMLDDMIAGIYTHVVLQLMLRARL